MKKIVDEAPAAAAPVETKAVDAVQEAEAALDKIVAADATPTAEELTVAQTKVEEAHAAVQTASSSATTEQKAELVKVESSLVAAKQIVSDAIAKAEAAAPGITQEAVDAGKAAVGL
jgi:hypothetical protein